ncbi:MAG: DivIVA domain-containing protein [Coriobacteriales bacterium]|nr:DivIVA domain-containing protein [Coriobacteriales bacterium]
MALTSKEINEQGFETQMRGYNIKQVDSYLEYIANEVDVLNNVIFEYEEQIEKLSNGGADSTQDLSSAVNNNEELLLELNSANAKIAEYEAKIEQMQKQIDSLTLKASSSAELDIANAKIKQLEDKLQTQRDNADVISEAYIAAQKGANELKEKARQEGERIYKEAETNARDFIRDAMTEKQKIVEEATKLKDSCDAFRAQYKEMLERFSLEAQTQFAQLASPEIPESSLDARMPASTYVSNNDSSATSKDQSTGDSSSIFDSTEDESVVDVVGKVSSNSPKSYMIDTDFSDLEEA